jgi:hypothetical protein
MEKELYCIFWLNTRDNVLKDPPLGLGSASLTFTLSSLTVLRQRTPLARNVGILVRLRLLSSFQHWGTVSPGSWEVYPLTAICSVPVSLIPAMPAPLHRFHGSHKPRKRPWVNPWTNPEIWTESRKQSKWCQVILCRYTGDFMPVLRPDFPCPGLLWSYYTTIVNCKQSICVLGDNEGPAQSGGCNAQREDGK